MNQKPKKVLSSLLLLSLGLPLQVSHGKDDFCRETILECQGFKEAPQLETGEKEARENRTQYITNSGPHYFTLFSQDGGANLSTSTKITYRIADNTLTTVTLGDHLTEEEVKDLVSKLKAGISKETLQKALDYIKTTQSDTFYKRFYNSGNGLDKHGTVKRTEKNCQPGVESISSYMQASGDVNGNRCSGNPKGNSSYIPVGNYQVAPPRLSKLSASFHEKGTTLGTSYSRKTISATQVEKDAQNQFKDNLNKNNQAIQEARSKVDNLFLTFFSKALSQKQKKATCGEMKVSCEYLKKGADGEVASKVYTGSKTINPTAKDMGATTCAQASKENYINVAHAACSDFSPRNDDNSKMDGAYTRATNLKMKDEKGNEQSLEGDAFAKTNAYLQMGQMVNTLKESESANQVCYTLEQGECKYLIQNNTGKTEERSVQLSNIEVAPYTENGVSYSCDALQDPEEVAERACKKKIPSSINPASLYVSYVQYKPQGATMASKLRSNEPEEYTKIKNSNPLSSDTVSMTVYCTDGKGKDITVNKGEESKGIIRTCGNKESSIAGHVYIMKDNQRKYIKGISPDDINE